MLCITRVSIEDPGITNEICVLLTEKCGESLPHVILNFKFKGNDNENNLAIKCEDKIITAETDLAKLFNNYFMNVASKLQEPIMNSEFEYLNTFVESKVPNDVEFKIPLTNAAFVLIHFYQI